MNARSGERNRAGRRANPSGYATAVATHTHTHTHSQRWTDMKLCSQQKKEVLHIAAPLLFALRLIVLRFSVTEGAAVQEAPNFTSPFVQHLQKRRKQK